MLAFIETLAEDPSDQDFIRDIYEQFYHLMYFTAQKYFKNMDICEKIVQDSLVRLIKQVAALRSLANPYRAAYITSTVRNTAINYLKISQKLNDLVTTLDDEESLELQSPLLSIDEQLLQMEQKEMLVRVLESLSEDDRILLEGKYVLEQSDRDLAALLGCKPSSIRMKLTRARRRALNLIVKEVNLTG